MSILRSTNIELHANNYLFVISIAWIKQEKLAGAFDFITHPAHEQKW